MFLCSDMGEKDVTILCYWNGSIVQGLEGLSYDKPPNKAIKVKSGINNKVLLNKMYSITFLNRQQFRIKMICSRVDFDILKAQDEKKIEFLLFSNSAKL